MSKWGLLAGAAQGMQRSADVWLTHEYQNMRDKWHEEQWQSRQQVGFDRQDKIRDEDRVLKLQDLEESRTHKEGLINDQNARADTLLSDANAREDKKSADEIERDKGKFKRLFSDSGEEIGKLNTQTNEFSPFSSKTQRSYLEPMTASRLKSLDSEISALQKSGFVEKGQKARMETLIKERDRIQVGDTSKGLNEAGIPPAPGAKQAEDGFWYIKRNNKWFRVD